MTYFGNLGFWPYYGHNVQGLKTGIFELCHNKLDVSDRWSTIITFILGMLDSGHIMAMGHRCSKTRFSGWAFISLKFLVDRVLSCRILEMRDSGLIGLEGHRTQIRY
jgi:hypothetical protein